jgi:AcrR family transcriptional regulator
MNDRLTRTDWIDQGLRTLAESGAMGLKVGAMAEALKVSRGSFYWHFRDIGDFRGQLLEAWRERTTDQVIQTVETEAVEPDRLKWLLRRAFGAAPRLDRAVRSWAGEDASVRAMVAKVDAARIAYITELLIGAGVARPTAAQRATFLYWAYLGQPTIAAPRHARMSAAAMEEISALFEG